MRTTTRRHPVHPHTGRCPDATLGCSCRGDKAVHEEREQAIVEARAHSEELLECPECGELSTPLSVVTWGHCRACRTAQSREIYPLRW